MSEQPTITLHHGSNDELIARGDGDRMTLIFNLPPESYMDMRIDANAPMAIILPSYREHAVRALIDAGYRVRVQRQESAQ